MSLWYLLKFELLFFVLLFLFVCVKKNSAREILTTSNGMKCDKCTFRNKPYALQCKMCNTFLVNAYVTQRKELLNFIEYIRTDDYASCKKWLQSWEKQGDAVLSASINYMHFGFMAPINVACKENNTAIVKLLLEYGADPNALNIRTMETTMHNAAFHANLEVMKLLVEKRFNLEQMNIGDGSGLTVFLTLCLKGESGIKCLDYILRLPNQNNKNKKNIHPYVVDIFARDHDGENGLHLAIKQDDFEMCQYLVKNVYNHKDLRDRIINDDVFQAAAQNTSKNCVSIFECLIQYKQSIFDDIKLLRAVLATAATTSWQIVSYMVENEEFYTKCPSVFEE